jgi:hypothetical protein
VRQDFGLSKRVPVHYKQSTYVKAHVFSGICNYTQSTVKVFTQASANSMLDAIQNPATFANSCLNLRSVFSVSLGSNGARDISAMMPRHNWPALPNSGDVAQPCCDAPSNGDPLRYRFWAHREHRKRVRGRGKIHDSWHHVGHHSQGHGDMSSRHVGGVAGTRRRTKLELKSSLKQKVHVLSYKRTDTWDKELHAAAPHR